VAEFHIEEAEAMPTQHGTRSSHEVRSGATAGLETTARPASIETQAIIDNDYAIHEQIARIAYELYLQRVANGSPGSAEGDWHLAEQQFAASRPRTAGRDQ
jgi:hypothetical protein